MQKVDEKQSSSTPQFIKTQLSVLTTTAQLIKLFYTQIPDFAFLRHGVDFKERVQLLYWVSPSPC